jgi:sortase A
VIPKIKLDTAIRPVGLQTIQEHGKTKLIWGTVDDAAGFHQTSAFPGNAGNTVINGHRDISGSVFLHLDRMKVGDRIIVLVGDVAYHYYATEVMVLPEALASAEQRERNAQLMGPMSEERLTLITCTPLGLATHRLLVIAKP